MLKKLKQLFQRDIKPKVFINRDEPGFPNKMTWVTVHHLDDIFELDMDQVKDAIIFYIEEKLQWVNQEQ